MAVPTWITGQVLTASDVNTWFVPLVAYKTAQTSRASNTTLAADPDLTLPVAASAFYQFQGHISYEGGTEGASDIKFDFQLPTGSTIRYHCIHEGTGGSADVVHTNTASFDQAGTKGTGVLCGCSFLGTLFTSSTSGSLIYRWCQNASSATSTIVHEQSHIMLRRIG